MDLSSQIEQTSNDEDEGRSHVGNLQICQDTSTSSSSKRGGSCDGDADRMLLESGREHPPISFLDLVTQHEAILTTFLSLLPLKDMKSLNVVHPRLLDAIRNSQRFTRLVHLNMYLNEEIYTSGFFAKYPWKNLSVEVTAFPVAEDDIELNTVESLCVHLSPENYGPFEEELLADKLELLIERTPNMKALEIEERIINDIPPHRLNPEEAEEAAEQEAP